MGSPPLARGKDRVTGVTPPHRGITPACAGKREFGHPYSKKTWDHPRLRGEKAPCPSSLYHQVGSPPLARGKEEGERNERLQSRITPACAGKRLCHSFCNTAKGDHPRLRGEKGKSKALNRASWGSPPLARGKAKSTAKS